MSEQVLNRNRQIMVRVHQTGRGSHNAVTIRVWVVAEGDLILIFQSHKPGHRVWTGAIHANLSVVIHRHEGESWIDDGIDHGNVKPVNRINWLPVIASGSAQR